ncbi:MAG: hypothetical protein ACYDBV_07460 [Nitrospiria bacterium]
MKSINYEANPAEFKIVKAGSGLAINKNEIIVEVFDVNAHNYKI